MSLSFPRTLTRLLVTLLLVGTAFYSKATHIFGMDLYYTYVSGTTYKVHLVVYADCSGSAFTTLAGAAPIIDVYDGGSYINSVNLSVETPSAGLEVTPVCPSQARNTTCTNPSNPLPGIKKFVYSSNITLSATSTVWRFLFNGRMSTTSSAGRSGSITNITIGSSGAPIQLVDTLNNSSGTNSSAVYTSIPTPFFCINTTSNFNPGAVDPEGDVLSFSLVPGMDAATSSSVAYVWPYSATAPLGVAAGTFSFSGTTGQISFYPNVVQKSLVVYNVRELRGGTLMGTSQREMTILVLSPCTNTPPTAVISSPSTGTTTTATQLSICNATDSFSFQINPTDADRDSLTMTVSGLPVGASFAITGNGTTSPAGVFGWRGTRAVPGLYTFYVTLRDNGCPITSTQTIAFTIQVLPSPTIDVNVLSVPTCVRPGMVRITPSGGTGPWVVNVLSGSTTVHIFTGVTSAFTDSLPPGTYTFRIYNSVFCITDTTLVLPAPAEPDATISVTGPVCTGDSTGTIIVAGIREAGSYTYALGTGSYSTSGVFTGLPAGTYAIHIRDDLDCVKDTNIVVPPPAPLLARLSITRPSCNGVSDGVVSITGYNTTAPYMYAKDSGAITASGTFMGLPAGRDTFHVIDGNGCRLDTVITLTDSTFLRAIPAITPITCTGGSAVIAFTTTGGIGSPFEYAEGSSAYTTTSTYSLIAGVYRFQVRDPRGCHFDTTITLTEPTPLLAAYRITNITCYGAVDGGVRIVASGSTPRYRYSADGGAVDTVSGFTGLAAGGHIFIVIDSNGCYRQDTIYLTEPTPLRVDSVYLIHPLCYGDTSGEVHIFAAGGTPGYTYAIGSGAYRASGRFIGLGAGVHLLHIKDANGCITDSAVTLTQPNRLTPTASVTPSFCQTYSNGIVRITATGGVPGYRFAVDAGAYNDSGVFRPLGAATYTFHVMDTNGCHADTLITVTDSLHIIGIFALSAAICNGDSNAVIRVSGAGGDTAYSYALGSGAFSATDTFAGLRAGTYVVHIRDANGCIADTAITLNEPNRVNILLSITPPLCYADTNAVVTASAYGGVAPYRYQLNNSGFTSANVFTGLGAGTDTLYVTDTLGCITDSVVTITQPTPLVVGSLSGKAITCHGGGDGMVVVYVTGGTPTYVFAAGARAFMTSPILTGLPAGYHSIRIRDGNGCLLDTGITLTQPAPLNVERITIVTPTCEGYADGSIRATAIGGNSPYQYSLDNLTFSDTASYATLIAGSYTLFIYDSLGCQFDTTLTLVGYPPIVIGNITVKPPTCKGTADGMITVEATGGIAPLTYQLGNALQTAPGVFAQLMPQVYRLIVTDSMGCKKETLVTMTDPDTLVLSATITPNDCLGKDDNGAIQVQVSGGISPYQYKWANDTATTSFIAYRPNGRYRVYVTDANNCSDTLDATIRYNDCCVPLIPNAFTPNGDGKNDVFRITYKGDIRVIAFAVYNRFGERVFMTEYSEDGWNGIYNGKQADIGTYYYYIRLLCGYKNDAIQELRGDVTLIR